MTKAVRLACAFIAVFAMVAVIVVSALSQTGPAPLLGKAPEATAEADGEDKLKEAVVLHTGCYLALVGNKETPIDSEDPETAPLVLLDDRGEEFVAVPVRFIAEALGLDVRWDEELAEAAVTSGDTIIKLKQGSDYIELGAEKLKLEAPVEAVNGRIFMPLYGLAKALELEVFRSGGLIVVSRTGNILDPEADGELIDELYARLNRLPAVESYDKLQALLKKSLRDSESAYDMAIRGGGLFGGDLDASVNQAEKADTAANSAQKTAASRSADYSGTNVQVQGVDEADVVKTDGSHIYQVNGNRLVIARAFPADEMKLESVTDFSDRDFRPAELYLHGEKLVVIGTSSGSRPGIRKEEEAVPELVAPSRGVSTVRAFVYDISDRTQLKKLREVELEGYYISSRKIGSHLYFAVNSPLDYYGIADDTTAASSQDQSWTPFYRDTAKGDEFETLDYGSIYYFPGSLQRNYLTVAGLDIDGGTLEASAYLGAGSSVYASAENLYVAVNGQRLRVKLPTVNIDQLPEAKTRVFLASAGAYEQSTHVYKFSLSGGKASYVGRGEFPGTVLNQFSMDEHEGRFRIATTRNVLENNTYISKNSVYIADKGMNITGRLDDLAPGEQIYSVRFMGDRGYVVTFKTVDPLFAIDLKDPARPEVLGVLKIPGYSDYLHPYDENHIIGFGKDTVEINGQAFYQGIKLALFDVTDVSRPVQKFSELIGDRGTESELLKNHRALLFSREKGLLAFPVTVMENADKTGDPYRDAVNYGQFAFQGAYVYAIDTAGGFKLKGKITHLSEEDYLKAGQNWYASNKNINRVLYIGDTLYTLSNAVYKAHGLEELEERGQLEIP